VTEDDFKTIASYGLNHVRIPIGYWALDTSKGEAYPQGQYPYLLKAVQWAAKYGLKVMIDIHGAPGSQNGFDNSGRRGSVNWQNDEENVKRTRAVLQTIVNTFAISAYADTVTAIELLNEPAGFVGQKMVDTVKQYYYDGYGEVRYPESTTSSSNTVVV
jgi:glucan 1,3-beta-glucosidase